MTLVNVVNDRLCTVPFDCPRSGEPVHVRFERGTFLQGLPDTLSCPSCGHSHTGLVHAYAIAARTRGWRATIEAGAGPPGTSHLVD